MKTLRRFLTLFIILAVLVGCGIYAYLSNRTLFNDTYVNGNTPGNLYNNGVFCEHNGTIYFSNPSDNHYLYSMDQNGGNLRKLYNDIASFINADDNYVYYVRNNLGADEEFAFLHVYTNSLCRFDLKTGKVHVLDTAPSIYASLVGNYLYYIHYDTETSSTLYRIKIDGSEKEQVDTNPYFTCSANGQYLYYNGLEQDHHIYQMDTVTGSAYTILQGNFWMPSAENDIIYFLDCEQNYALYRLGRNDTSPVKLGNDRIEYYNVYGDTIYYQRNNLNGDSALCCMNTDGSNERVIAEGSYKNINVTSQYVYFSEAGNEDTVYQTPVGGYGDVSVFMP